MNRYQRVLAAGALLAVTAFSNQPGADTDLQDRRNEYAANPGPGSSKDRRRDSGMHQNSCAKMWRRACVRATSVWETRFTRSNVVSITTTDTTMTSLA